jgi:hypothetical protein
MLEPVDAGLTAMGGAVVDHPEHPTRGRVGLAGHHLVDQPVARVDAGGGFAAAEHLGAVDVPGDQVGQGAAAEVLRLDARRLVRCRGCGGVFAAGLDGGLLVGGDDVLVGPQWCEPRSCSTPPNGWATTRSPPAWTLPAKWYPSGANASTTSAWLA